jgi:hypothetical protein
MSIFICVCLVTVSIVLALAIAAASSAPLAGALAENPHGTGHTHPDEMSPGASAVRAAGLQ